VESPVIHQTQAAPASEGHEERYIVPFTVFPGGQDALGCEDARHGEVKACVTDEQVGPLGGATHEPVEPQADSGPLAVSDLEREMVDDAEVELLPDDLRLFSGYFWHILAT